MNEFEKVEKLVQKANVSFEDAKNALQAADGDMLDAMIALEKAGKVKGPQQTEYSTSYQQAPQYKDVPLVVQNSNNTKNKSVFNDIGRAIKNVVRYTIDNYIRVEHKKEEIIKVPLWVGIIALMIGWGVIIVLMIVSLFFDCRYSITGKSNPKEVNEILSQASELAGKAKQSFNENAAPADASAATYTTTTVDVNAPVDANPATDTTDSINQ